MPRAKHWYWEAEQDRIAADEDLRFLPSPDGWPGEGLECVGLWFLLMNQMWRSARVGFLCDPVNPNAPLTDAKLASLVGRDSAVVQPVLRVLLERKLFAKTESGIIYSRGIVRKEKLRQKRASAGKKGGLRSHDLLKQKVEQNAEQTLGIGIRIGSKNELGSDFETPAALSVAWEHYRSGCKGENERLRARTAFEELVRRGVSLQTIDQAIRDPKRNRLEAVWTFADRLLVANGIDGSKPAQFSGIKAWLESQKGATNDQG